MPETATLRCQTCGQGWQLNKADEYNLTAPKFCPCCGHTGKLEKSSERITFKSELGGTYFVERVAAFATIDPQLLVMLYQDWRLALRNEPTTTAKRFMDYVKEQLG